jgi:hemerythrin superfamily protein
MRGTTRLRQRLNASSRCPVYELVRDGRSEVAAPASTPDALQLLRSDHRSIGRLLDDCAALARRRSSSRADRSGLLMRLGALLMTHARVEEELFYPLLRTPPWVVDDARNDHVAIELHFRRLHIGGLSAADFGVRVATLSQLLQKHFAEEEQQLFEHARALPLHALGARMAARRAALLGDPGED